MMRKVFTTEQQVPGPGGLNRRLLGAVWLGPEQPTRRNGGGGPEVSGD